jgi:hypothetical protein
VTALDWILSCALFAIYIVCLFTVCWYTFKKGHWVLGIIGIIFPILWLIGAILPAKPGSQYDIQEHMRMQSQIQEMTS